MNAYDRRESQGSRKNTPGSSTDQSDLLESTASCWEDQVGNLSAHFERKEDSELLVARLVFYPPVRGRAEPILTIVLDNLTRGRAANLLDPLHEALGDQTAPFSNDDGISLPNAISPEVFANFVRSIDARSRDSNPEMDKALDLYERRYWEWARPVGVFATVWDGTALTHIDLSFPPTHPKFELPLAVKECLRMQRSEVTAPPNVDSPIISTSTEIPGIKDSVLGLFRMVPLHEQPRLHTPFAWIHAGARPDVEPHEEFVALARHMEISPTILVDHNSLEVNTPRCEYREINSARVFTSAVLSIERARPDQYRLPQPLRVALAGNSVVTVTTSGVRALVKLMHHAANGTLPEMASPLGVAALILAEGSEQSSNVALEDVDRALQNLDRDDASREIDEGDVRRANVAGRHLGRALAAMNDLTELPDAFMRMIPSSELSGPTGRDARRFRTNVVRTVALLTQARAEIRQFGEDYDRQESQKVREEDKVMSRSDRALAIANWVLGGALSGIAVGGLGLALVQGLPSAKIDLPRALGEMLLIGTAVAATITTLTVWTAGTLILRRPRSRRSNVRNAKGDHEIGTYDSGE